MRALYGGGNVRVSRRHSRLGRPSLRVLGALMVVMGSWALAVHAVSATRVADAEGLVRRAQNCFARAVCALLIAVLILAVMFALIAMTRRTHRTDVRGFWM